MGTGESPAFAKSLIAKASEQRHRDPKAERIRGNIVFNRERIRNGESQRYVPLRQKPTFTVNRLPRTAFSVAARRRGFPRHSRTRRPRNAGSRSSEPRCPYAGCCLGDREAQAVHTPAGTSSQAVRVWSTTLPANTRQLPGLGLAGLFDGLQVADNLWHVDLCVSPEAKEPGRRQPSPRPVPTTEPCFAYYV